MATQRQPPLASRTPAPAPWTTHCEYFWLLTWPSSPLAKGTYDSLESSHLANDLNHPISGPGMIQIVRYTNTPVGPYDELVYLPGLFTTPGGSRKGKKHFRVTRIYVSQRETCHDGRVNWNIPKHLARFEFSHPVTAKGQSPPKRLEMKVFPPSSEEGSDKPFFQATLTPSTWLPSFPLSTRWMPLSTLLVQPPLPKGEDRDLPGTDVWRSSDLQAWTKRARVMWVDQKGSEEGGLEEKGKWWPNVKPWSFGIWLQNATLEIAVPEEFEA